MTPTDIIKPGDEARDITGPYNRRWRPVNFSVGKTPAEFPHLEFRRPETAMRLAIENTCKACEQERHEILLRAAKDLLDESRVMQDINGYAYVDLKKGSYQRLKEVVERNQAEASEKGTR